MSVLLASAILISGLTLRTGKVDITPPEPLPLGGYTERGGKLMEPGGERLFARGFELSQGNLRIRVISAEMLTIPESLHREVRAKTPAGTHLFLVATHTHSAPDSQMLNERMTMPVPGIATYKARWLEWYADKLGKIAFGAPAPAQSVHGHEFDPGLNRGRRLAAFPDPIATRVVATTGKGDTPLFLHYAAHPILLGPVNLKTHGDWPGVVPGEGAVLTGAIGDVSPAASSLEDFATRFGAAKGKRPEKREWHRPGDVVGWAEQPIALGAVTPHPEFAKRYGVPDVLAALVVKGFAPEQGTISAFRLGKLAVVGIPGEPTSHLGRRIRDYGRRLGFSSVLVVSHVNGWIGYILLPEDYDRGGYEATLAFHGRETGLRVAEAAEKALRNLARR